jgi:hypothetical protein
VLATRILPSAVVPPLLGFTNDPTADAWTCAGRVCGWADPHGLSFGLCAACDVEARRWRDYAERWDTDQYDEGPSTWTVGRCADRAYKGASELVRVWLVLLDVGLVD